MASIQDLLDIIEADGWFAGGSIFLSIVTPKLPLSAAEWIAIDNAPGDMTAENKRLLIQRDLDAGGSGPP